jgi:sialic acid synthase SpsE
MVRGIRMVESCLGSDRKEPTEAEKLNTRGMRRSIVAVVDIEPGKVIERGMLAFKRPATGLEPGLLPKVVGKRAKTRIAADTPLQSEQIEW